MMNSASMAVPDPSNEWLGLMCDSFSAWWANFMAATGERVVEVEEAREDLENAEASLSDR